MPIERGPLNPVNLTPSGTVTFPDLRSVQVSAPNRHSVRPTLVLDFANSRTLDPRVAFTRGSNATFYDGSTVIVEQNFLAQSQDISDSVWDKTNSSVVANSTTAPDGTTTADTLTKTVNSSSRIMQLLSSNTNFKSGQTYTISAYVKNINATHVFLGPNTWDGVGAAVAEFSFSTNAVSRTAVFGNWVVNSTSMTLENNGFYRISMTFTVGAVSSTFTHRIHIGFGDGTTSIASDAQIVNNSGNGHSFFIWGIQFEQSRFANVYEPTTTTPITTYMPALRTAGVNLPRFEVDPTTKESVGLIIEEQRTNLVPNIDSASWISAGNIAKTSNFALAPDGTNTAIRLRNSGTSNPVYYAGSVSGTNAFHTFSAFLKRDIASANTKAALRLDYPGHLARTATFDLSNGTIITGETSSDCSPTIKNIGGGWYRCSVTTHISTTLSNAVVQSDILSSTASALFWGVQVEIGRFATSYIPTGSTTSTRSADNATIWEIDTSTWFNEQEGTIFTDALWGGQSANVDGATVAFESTGSERIRIYETSNSSTFLWQAKNSSFFTFSETSSGVNRKSAAAYATGNYSIVGNGGGVTSSTNSTIYVYPTYMAIGRSPTDGSALWWNGSIRKISYYSRRLSNSELQGLTTD